MKRKRLLVCTPSYSTQGGVERILETLHRLLPARGFEVVFALARGARFQDPRRYLEAYPGISHVEIEGVSGTRAGRLRGLRRAIAATQPDVVLAARLYDVYQAACELKAHRGGPYLATLVQTYEAEYIADAHDYAAYTDLCVTGGRLTALAMVKWVGLPAERVRSIPGSIAPPTVRKCPSPVGAPLRLGYVGRFEQVQKRIRDLPELLGYLARRGVPFEMELVGGGPEEAWLRERIAHLGLQERVHFRGWMSTQELYGRVYPTIDVFVHFAHMEGAPIALAEALLHGIVPVVSEFTGCHTEGLFVHGHNALLYPVGDTKRAADHVERLHGDRALLERLSGAAAGSRDKVLSPEEMADAWAEALTTALAAPPVRNGRLPSPRFPPPGRLERWGIPPRWADTLRRATGRRAWHNDPGSEWPHCSGLATAQTLEEIAAFGRQEEERQRLERLAFTQA